MKPFEYKQSHKIINWRTTFDSLLELKFAISIQHDYYFLRSHIPVYYDLRTRIPTDYIRHNIRRYTPDFLIRHKQTNAALWVEVKPRAFEGQEQLTVRTEVANNYIQWKKYDWKFKVVFDDEIHLSKQDGELFNRCRRKKTVSQHLLALQNLNNRYDTSQPSFFTRAPSNKIIRLVMFGTGSSIS